MPLWFLSPIKTGDGSERDYVHEGFSNYDVFDGFVIRAGSEQEARELATARSEKVQGYERFADHECVNTIQPWRDPALVSCERIVDGDTRVILESFHHG